MTAGDGSARRVLVIAYYFPPLGGAGVQRILKFVKYLPEHGYRSTVITTASRAYPAHDEALGAEVPAGTVVRRARDLPLGHGFVLLFDRLGWDRLRWLAAFPDGGRGWLPGALAQAVRAARRERPDVILSTSAPFSAHLVALAVHAVTGIPWVADFRDEWAANPELAAQPALLRRAARWAERAITRHAASVVLAADYFDVAGARAGRTRVICNGVDEDDLGGLPDVRPPADRLRLTFVGTLYGEQNLAPVLAAVRRLADRGLMELARVELRVVGNVWIPGFAARSPVPLTTTGYVDHRRALAEMASAGALLFHVGAASLAPSGKLFEYLASGRPILCVARPDGLAWGLVERWEAGACAAPDDPEAIDAALLSLYRRWTAGDLASDTPARAQVLADYSRRRLTAELASVLDLAVRGAHGRAPIPD